MTKRIESRQSKRRYEAVTAKKAEGATYTPSILADFVAEQIIKANINAKKRKIRILDPAVGDGELLISLLDHIPESDTKLVEVHGYETDAKACQLTQERLKRLFPRALLNIHQENFLESTLSNYDLDLFNQNEKEKFDLIIANPPYVRTQIMGAGRSKELAKQFGLRGRVDLYHAFIIAMGKVIKPGGIAGIIVSNRFMTTRTGISVRNAIRKIFKIIHIWDFGDTKLFEVAVLPAVLILEGKISDQNNETRFTSIYQTEKEAEYQASNPVEALRYNGAVQVSDGRKFLVKSGTLCLSNDSKNVWRMTNEATDLWLDKVDKHTWEKFGYIGKIRVGVKTCADKVYIRTNWKDWGEPELLRPIMTHHIAHRFKAFNKEKQRYILYPHKSITGKRQAINIEKYPKSKKYLEEHRDILENRSYVLEAGRNWYEIWVPQNPELWDRTKLVFRDISEKPVFWIDREKSIVNGDCYFLVPEDEKKEDLLWLAAGVGNSTFMESYYDHCYNNKLYAGRRRFMTQYVEQFPLPDPNSRSGKAIIKLAKEIFSVAGTEAENKLINTLDKTVWSAFGLPFEEV